nr:hypothetical protein [uncultured Mediterranean phage uvMED]BAR31489.1 hypothetical protein [uncultured Mediterranean phage uvMED]
MKKSLAMKYHLSATTKCTSMSMGNLKFWFTHFKHFPINIYQEKE